VSHGPSTVRFGEFEVDLRSGELHSSGNKVRIQDQPFKVLSILLEQPNQVVTREELQKRIWPEENFGDFDHAVNVAVAKLRTALGDSADTPRYVETIPRRGYRLIAPIERDPTVSEPAVEITHQKPGAPSRHRLWQRRYAISLLGLLLVVSLLVALVSGLRKKGHESASQSSSRKLKLVVLPFENLGSQAG